MPQTAVPSVLVLEDDPEYAQLLKLVLRSIPCHAHFAESVAFRSMPKLPQIKPSRAYQSLPTPPAAAGCSFESCCSPRSRRALQPSCRMRRAASRKSPGRVASSSAISSAA
jgi:hypothetical protein